MEQRALLASALVLGCVTAAGAGGFLAVRQMAATAAEPAEQVANGPVVTPADPAEGTVAEILPPNATPTSALPQSAPPSGTVAVRETPRPAAPRPAAARPTAAPAAAPASGRARPATTARRDDSATAARPLPSEPPPTSNPMPSSGQAPAETSPRDTWPSRESGTTSDDRWASRDAGAGAAGPDATPLPSRAPVNDTEAAPAPVRRLENVTIPANAVIGIQVEQGVSTASAKVEDPVRARVTRDLLAGGDVVIPAGSRLLGNVTLVEEGGRMKERARLGIRFHTLVLADGTEIKLPTETIYRDGESVAGRTTAKIGGAAIGGAILGAIMGGGKGAIIGAASGAGSGTGWAMAGDRKPAELRAGQALTVRLSDSVTTQVER